MTYRITITAGPVTMKAELNDSPTAHKIWEALPITGRAKTWGDKIYVERVLGDATDFRQSPAGAMVTLRGVSSQ